MPALIIDPALQAAVIRQFNLRGELAPFNLTENVVPVFDIGALTGNLPTVVTTLAGSQGVRVGVNANTNFLPVLPPAYDDTDIVDDVTVNPAAAAVLADTGQLAAGIQMVYAQINWNTAIVDFQLEWRNAANSATLATFQYQVGTGLPHASFGPLTLNVVVNERLRWATAGGGTGTSSSSIASRSVARSIAS